MSTSEAFNSTARCREQTKFWPRRKGTHCRHRSHFGSRYKTGCCGHASLLDTSWFESRLRFRKPYRGSRSRRAGADPRRCPSLSTARATPHPTRSVFGANPPTQSRLKHRPPGVGAPLPTDTQFGGHPTAPGASPARRGSVHPQIEDRHPEHAVAGARYRTNPSVPQCPVARLGRPQNTTAEAGYRTNPAAQSLLHLGPGSDRTPRREPCTEQTRPARPTVFPSHTPFGQPHNTAGARNRTNRGAEQTARPQLPLAPFGSHKDKIAEPGAEQTRPPAIALSSTRQPQ